MYQPDDLFFQRYRLVEQLGLGGFSQVWRAQDEKAGVEVAIKIFNRQDAKGVSLCRQEYQQAHHLVHPNILRPLFFDDFDGAPFLVLPYCQQGSIASRVGILSWDELKKLIVQVGAALQYLHSRSMPLVHSDIKPDNILIDEEGNFLLSDFGISRYVQVQLTRTMAATYNTANETGATPVAYRAPELFNFRDQVQQEPAPATDIWAFGATLYQVTTSQLPFNGEGGFTQYLGMATHGAMLEDLLLPLPARYGASLQSLIFKCLALNPAQRPCAEALTQASARLEPPARSLTPILTSTGLSYKGNQVRDSSKIVQVKQHPAQRSKLLWGGIFVGIIILIILAGIVVVAGYNKEYQWHIREADKYFQMGDYTKAKQLYEQVIDTHFDNEELRRKIKDTEKALTLASYSSIRESTDDLAAAAMEQNGRYKWGFIDIKTGEIRIPIVYDSVGDFKDGMAQVWHFGRYEFIDRSGGSKPGVTLQPIMQDTVQEKILAGSKPGKLTFRPNADKPVKTHFSCYTPIAIGPSRSLYEACSTPQWESGSHIVKLIPKVPLQLVRAAVAADKRGKVQISLMEGSKKIGDTSLSVSGSGVSKLEIGILNITLFSGKKYTLIIEPDTGMRLQDFTNCGAVAKKDSRVAVSYQGSIVLLDLEYCYE